MADEATQDAATEAVEDQTEETTTDADESTADDGEGAEEGAEALGDKGKQALDRMKAKWQTERDKRIAAEAKLTESTPEEDKEQRKAESAALAKANERIVRSEIKAAAKGVLADPADAFKFLDLSQFEVNDDGDVDEDEIADAISDLVKTKPYLAAAQGQQQRFRGKADQGARKATQVSEEQQLTEALGEAEKARDFVRAIQIKQRLAAVRREASTA